MKKVLLSIVLCLAVVCSGGFTAFADSGIEENPNIKVVIDCKAGTYTSSPIVVNDRTLLPLRELLVNLGVQNDDGHIIWNGSERSVTIKKDSINIYLKVGSTAATVNNVSKKLDAAPVEYKDRVYIPARFIAESFGKKVAWDEKSSMVLMRDEAEFTKVKGMLDKVTAAMDAQERYKSVDTLNTNIYNDKIRIKTSRIQNSETDNKNKLGYAVQEVTTNSAGRQTMLKVELGVGNKMGFLINSRMSEPIKVPITDEKFSDSFKFKDLISTDVLCAGLEATETDKTITLAGDINIGHFLDSGLDFEDITEYTLNGNMSSMVTIDKDTNLVREIYAKASGETTADENIFKFDAEAKSVYSEYNGSFTVALPTYFK